MTRIQRIIAHRTKKIGVNPIYPGQSRSINSYTDLKTALESENR